MVPLLRGFVIHLATPIAFLVAYGELPLGSRWFLESSCPAGAFGLLYMLTLLFSSDYPGVGAPFWRYFGASLDPSVLALCFWRF